MRVVWTLPALDRLDEIQTYIAENRPAAAYRVVKEILERTDDALSRNPMLGRVGRTGTTREFVLANLPYIVVYRVGDHLEIVDV